MGGLISSRSDPYVLKYEAGLSTAPNSREHSRPALYAANPPSNNTHSNNQQKGRKNSRVYPLQAVPSVPPPLPDKPPNKHLMRAQSQLVMPTALTLSPRTLKSRPSLPNLLAPAKGSAGNDKLSRCSDKYPWLLKQSNFSNYALSDFEFGRVIGNLCFSLSSVPLFLLLSSLFRRCFPLVLVSYCVHR
jgi:hypothetical protein